MDVIYNCWKNGRYDLLRKYYLNGSIGSVDERFQGSMHLITYTKDQQEAISTLVAIRRAINRTTQFRFETAITLNDITSDLAYAHREHKIQLEFDNRKTAPLRIETFMGLTRMSEIHNMGIFENRWKQEILIHNIDLVIKKNEYSFIEQNPLPIIQIDRRYKTIGSADLDLLSLSRAQNLEKKLVPGTTITCKKNELDSWLKLLKAGGINHSLHHYDISQDKFVEITAKPKNELPIPPALNDL